MTIHTRLYAIALTAFPKRHRDAYSAEMIDAFEQELARRSQGGMLFTLSACGNAIATGIGERWRHRRVGHTDVLFNRLDFILAWRMMIRYPGLTIVALFGMAVGIAIAAGGFAVLSAMSSARLPLPDGDAIVSIWDVDTVNGRREARTLYDLNAWRRMTSVEDIGIARDVQRTLIAEGESPNQVTVAEISASAFRIARVAAIRGRVLLPEDESPGAPNALVIGYDAWVRRFNRDPRIVGRSVRLGRDTYAIVGVMPEGFRFPLFHSYWIPWRVDTTAFAPRTGPSVRTFARLNAGATIDGANAEIVAVSRILAEQSPDTHEHLHPRVTPYAYQYIAMGAPEFALALYVMQLALVMVLLVVCVNVAILVYARTASRVGEIAVRGALGASRRRIIAQLFIEALMLSGIAAAAGSIIADAVLRQINGSMLIVFGGTLPFWMSMTLSTPALLYVCALTIAAAAIIGVVPALKATSARVHTRLQTLSPGSGSKMNMGRIWATLIVAQVAFTVMVLPASMYHAWTSLRFRIGDLGFASAEFLTTQMVVDREAAPPAADDEQIFAARVASVQRELDRRIRENAAVTDVTFALAAIGEERAAVLEVEGHPVPEGPVDYNVVAGTRRGHLVRFNRVATNYFDAFGVPIVMGRALQASDAGLDGAGVLVNRDFVDTVFGGSNPLGARVRYVGRSREADEHDVVLDRWYEIVGVVPNFPNRGSFNPVPVSQVYHAAAFGDVHPAEIAIRIRGIDPNAFAGPLREIGVSVDPDLQLKDIVTAESSFKREQGMMRLIGIAVTLVMLSVIALTAAGMYALMSFTVAQRRKEIGIRAALGADRHRLLTGIFARAIGQIGIGVAIGLAGAFALESILQGEMFQGQGAVLLPAVIVVMGIVGVFAVAGPARRGLAIQPIEVLRDE